MILLLKQNLNEVIENWVKLKQRKNNKNQVMQIFFSSGYENIISKYGS